MGWDYYDYYEPSRPKKAQGGIKAQSKRGSFGQTWWGKRWIEVVESLGLGSRLNRGKFYARTGQVLSIEVEKGQVTATVQGSRAKPYKQRIKYNCLAKALTDIVFRFSATPKFAENLPQCFRNR